MKGKSYGLSSMSVLLIALIVAVVVGVLLLHLAAHKRLATMPPTVAENDTVWEFERDGGRVAMIATTIYHRTEIEATIELTSVDKTKIVAFTFIPPNGAGSGATISVVTTEGDFDVTVPGTLERNGREVSVIKMRLNFRQPLTPLPSP